METPAPDNSIQNFILETSHENPSKLILDFIMVSKMFCKKDPIHLKNKEANKISLEIIHHFTCFKFHPYSNYTYELNSIKHIQEIDFIEENKKVILAYTKKVHNLIPSCRFTLFYQRNQWKISKVEVIRGTNLFYSIFI